MREFSFSSFLVTEGNRRAHELCLAISRGEPVSPLPLILTGEPGSGKTHLLRAVAQRLRASVGHAAIVLFARQSAAEEIERLVADPEPIDMARYAVLLVDDFQAPPCDPRKLARVIEIFLENDHPVILASALHPDRLAALPPELIRIVRAGQTVTIDGGDAGAARQVVESQIRDEQRAAVQRLEQRVRELESGGPESAAKEAGDRARAVRQLQLDLKEARAEIEHLRGENSLLGVAAREAGDLRKRLERDEHDRIELAKQPPAATSERSEELKRKLDEARFDAQKAREEARGMLERAQLLLGELHKSREEYDSAQRVRERHWEEIRRFQEAPGPARPADSEPLEQTGPASPEAAGLEAAAPMGELRDDIHRLQESLVRARAERDNAKSHLSHIRDELDAARADLERVRDEAAKERTEYETRIQELEALLVERHSEIERLQGILDSFAGELRAVQSQVTEGADVLQHLMDLFGEAAPHGDRAAAGPGLTEELPAAESGDVPDRADFGEGIKLAPRRGPSLHHVEEMRHANPALFSGRPAATNDAQSDADEFEGRMRSA